MKKVLLIAAMFVGAVSFSKAQGQGGGGGGGRQQGTPEERAQRTVDGQQLASLNLTADQKAKLLPLLVKTNKSLDSLNATVTVAADADQATRMAAMAPLTPKRTAITDWQEKTFVAWLTADQKKAYDALLATAKERNPNTTGILVRGGFGGGRGGQGGGGGGGGNRPAGGGAPATPPNE